LIDFQLILSFEKNGEKKYHHCVVGKRKKCIFAGFLKWNANASGKWVLNRVTI
jgi:hypothetical protein